MITGVIFDWGGVLIDDPEPGIAAYCSSQLGVTGSLFREARKEYAPAIFRGEISEAEYWQKVCSVLQVAVPTKPLIAEALRQSYKARPVILSLVRKLKEDGYKTALLSNIEEPSTVLFDELSYKDLFDAVMFSCRCRIAKPHPQIYQRTLEDLAIPAEEALFIDDREENIEGARAVGLRGILYQNKEQTYSDLQQAGVAI